MGTPDAVAFEHAAFKAQASLDVHRLAAALRLAYDEFERLANYAFHGDGAEEAARLDAKITAVLLGEAVATRL